MTLVSAGNFLQSGLDNCRSEQTLSQRLTILTALDTLLFLHVLSVVSSQTTHRAVQMKMSYRLGNLVGLTVKRMGRA